MLLKPARLSARVPAQVGDLQNSGGLWKDAESDSEDNSAQRNVRATLKATGSPAPRRSQKASRWRSGP